MDFLKRSMKKSKTNRYILAAMALGCNLWPSAGEAPPPLRGESPSSSDPNVLRLLRDDLDPMADVVLEGESQRYLLQYARLLCNGNHEKAATLPEPEELQSIHAPLILYCFGPEGRVIGQARVDDPALSLREKVLQGVAGMGPGARDGYLHLLVVSFTARLPNFGIAGIFDWKVFEPWVTGVAYEFNGRRAELDPMQMMIRNLSAKDTRAVLCRELGVDPKKAPSLNGLRIEFYRVIHFGEEYPSRRFASFFRGHKVFTTADVTQEVVQERLRWIARWYKANVYNGEVTYEYSVSRQKYRNEKRTMVRSTMAAWILNRLAYYLDDPELQVLGREVLEHYLEAYFNMARSLQAGRIQASPVPLPNGNVVAQRYTTASFIAAAILERVDWAHWRREVDLLMEFAMGYRRPDGYLWTPYGQAQYFEPGQLLLSLAYAYGRTRDPGYKQYFDELYAAYEKPLYESMHLGNGIYFPYAPAWFTQPAAEMYRQTGENRYRDFIYRINDRVVKLYEFNARHQVYYDYDGLLVRKHDTYGNTSIVAACLESLVDAAVTARRDGDAVRYETYTRVIRPAVAFLLRAQYLPENTYYIENRERVLGGFKRSMIDTTSWMDNVWHLTSALIKIQRERLLEPASTAGSPVLKGVLDP